MDGSGTTRVLSRLWFVVVAVLVITILYVAKVLFLPLAFAVLFAFLLAPLVSWLERLHLPRALAAILVILGFAALLGAAAWMLFTQLVAVTNDLPTYRDNITQKMEAIHSPSDSAFSRAQRVVERLSDQLGLANSSAVLYTPPQQPGNKPLGASPDRPVQVREVARPTGRLDQLGGILEPLTTSLLCVVFTFFVLLQREDLRNRIIHLSGDHITALYFIGLPHAVLFGSMAGLLRFVPYVGAPVAALLPTLLSLAVFHGWTHSLMIVGTFTLLEVVTANYVEPRIYGKHTGLSSLAILMAAAFWTLLWGPVGLVLSVPLTVCLVVIGRHVPALEFLTVMLGDQPVVPPAACYYQRLLAHDQREAGEILDTCLRNSSLETTYDSVLIPALLMSKQDRAQGDLDETTIEFIPGTTRELIEELGFRDVPEGEASPAGARVQLGKVLCVPVRDETDELGALMLAQLLELEGIQGLAIPVRRADEILATIAAENPEIVFLSGPPPFGMARAHRLYRSVRARYPHLRLLLGIWGYADDLGKASQKISREDAVHVSTTLADGVAQVRSFASVAEAAEPSEANAA